MDLLLLPGLLCDAASWAPVVSRLDGIAACRVAEYGDASSLPAMARRVLADAPPAFALAGHSMGARVAYEIVRQAPERITHVALLDTGYRAVAGDERARRLALLEFARKSGMRAMAREWVRPMVHPARLDDGPLVDAIVEMVARCTPEQFAAQIEALLARPDAEALLRTLRVPTLVACGRQDAWSPLAQHEEIAALVPASRLVVFEDSGHMSPMERPVTVASALIDWLQRPALTGRHAAGLHA